MTLNVIVHVHHHFDGGPSEVEQQLRLIRIALGKLTMTQQELNDTLDKLTVQVTKIGTETAANNALVKELQGEIIAGQTVSQATVDKLNTLAAGIQTVDDLVPDAPPAP